ncbi:MAG: hypothetical protein ACK50J_23750, partial [Planctomyces sp.]
MNVQSGNAIRSGIIQTALGQLSNSIVTFAEYGTAAVLAAVRLYVPEWNRVHYEFKEGRLRTRCASFGSDG